MGSVMTEQISENGASGSSNSSQSFKPPHHLGFVSAHPCLLMSAVHRVSQAIFSCPCLSWAHLPASVHAFSATPPEYRGALVPSASLPPVDHTCSLSSFPSKKNCVINSSCVLKQGQHFSLKKYSILPFVALKQG